jgi:sulfatase modifying factor 1
LPFSKSASGYASPGSVSAAGSGFDDSRDPGNWSAPGWFGTFYTKAGTSWVYHATHLWLYIPEGQSTDSLWIWDPGLGWVWTSSGHYPFLYQHDQAGWLWYYEGSAAPRKFFEYSTKGTKSVGSASTLSTKAAGTSNPTTGSPFDVSSAAGLEMLWVTPGTYSRGSPESEADRQANGSDETLHTVTLTKGFWIGKYEVTQAQYEAVTGNAPSLFEGSSLPVEHVNWRDAMDFCDQVHLAEAGLQRIPQSYHYRLPTEAEWEYACRAGTVSAFSFGNSLSSSQANFDGYVGNTTAVGTYPANPWGFHDMHGNVGEWCYDVYQEYPIDSVTDPLGMWQWRDDFIFQVVRGGGWFQLPTGCRSAYRRVVWQNLKISDIGFRLCLGQRKSIVNNPKKSS